MAYVAPKIGIEGDRKSGAIDLAWAEEGSPPRVGMQQERALIFLTRHVVLCSMVHTAFFFTRPTSASPVTLAKDESVAPVSSTKPFSAIKSPTALQMRDQKDCIDIPLLFLLRLIHPSGDRQRPRPTRLSRNDRVRPYPRLKVLVVVDCLFVLHWRRLW